MFPACSADHNCCAVAETFFEFCTCSKEECAFDAAGAVATPAFAPSGSSTFALCGLASGFATAGSEIDAPGDRGCATDERVCSPLDCAARFALAVVGAGLPGLVPPA